MNTDSSKTDINFYLFISIFLSIVIGAVIGFLFFHKNSIQTLKKNISIENFDPQNAIEVLDSEYEGVFFSSCKSDKTDQIDDELSTGDSSETKSAPESDTDGLESEPTEIHYSRKELKKLQKRELTDLLNIDLSSDSNDQGDEELNDDDDSSIEHSFSWKNNVIYSAPSLTKRNEDGYEEDNDDTDSSSSSESEEVPVQSFRPFRNSSQQAPAKRSMVRRQSRSSVASN